MTAEELEKAISIILYDIGVNTDLTEVFYAIKEIASLIEQQQPESGTAEEILMSKQIFFAPGQARYVIQAMEQYAQQQYQIKDKEIKKLKFMIDNGLGWEDMRNDITMPHEI